MHSDETLVWCPMCSHPLRNEEGVEVVVCAACRLPVPWESAWQMSRGWAAIHSAKTRTAAAAAQLESAQTELTAASTELAEAEHVTAAWRSYAVAEMRNLVATPVAGAPIVSGSARAVAAPAAAPRTVESVSGTNLAAPTTGPHRFPIAVILQVAGALLLLSAVVVASAVLWGFLNPLGQAAFLFAIVATTALVSVVVGRRLPTTGIVLAALTLAVALVVVFSLPSRLPSLEFSSYPTIALIAYAAGFFLLGTWQRVRLWQHAGVAAIPLIVAVAVTTLLPSVIDLDGPLWLALAACGFLLAAIALLRAGEHPDFDTAITARIGSYLSAGVGTALAAVGFLASLADAAGWRELFAESLAIVLVAAYGLLLSAHVRARSAAAATLWRALAVLALTPLPALLFIPADVNTWWAATLWGGAAVAVVAVWTWWAVRGHDALGIPTALAVPGVGLCVAGIWLFSALGLVFGDDPGAWVWLLGAITGVGWAAVFIGAGLVLRQTASVVSGWSAGVIAWLLLAGSGHTGDTVDSAFLPVIIWSLALWWFARRRAVPLLSTLPSATAQVIVLAGTVPIAVVGWVSLLDEQQFVPRLLGWTLAAVVVAGILVWRQRTGWVATAAGAVLLCWPWVLSAQVHSAQQSLERYTLPIALCVLVLALAGTHDGYWSRASGMLIAGLVALIPSTIAALVLPVEWGDAPQWRSVVVLTAWGLGATWWVRKRSTLAMVCWIVVVVVSTWWVLVALASRSLASPEQVTVPLAVGAMFIVGWIRFPHGRGRWWTEVVAAPLIAVVAVSSLTSLLVDAFVDGVGEWVRMVACLLVWLALTVGYWTKPWWAFGFGTVAAGFTWLSLIRLLTQAQYSGPVEIYTVSAAEVVAIVTALFLRASSLRLPSILTMGPTMALVLWPTALLAWSSDNVGWRLWAALAASALTLVVGVVWRRAGLLVPGLIGIVMVTLPVLLQVVSDLPAWLPLTVIGLILVGIGARFEAVRRNSVETWKWARQLK